MTLKEQIEQYVQEAYPKHWIPRDGQRVFAEHYIKSTYGFFDLPEILIFKPYKAHAGLALETDPEHKMPMYQFREMGFQGYFVSDFAEAKMIIDTHL